MTIPSFNNVLEAPREGARPLSEVAGEGFRAILARGRVPVESFWDWAQRVPEPKAGKLDFRRFPFQIELYQQAFDDKQMVIAKSTQVGVSAWATRWGIYHTDIRGMTGLYIFPTVSDMYDYVDARVRPVIDGSEYLQGRVIGVKPQNKGLMRVGLGVIYWRGSESKRKFDSVDADHLVLDEYDTLNQELLPDAERRLSGSLHGLIRRVGVPSIPEYGIDKVFQASDQRYWHVRCDACGERQPITFEDNVDLERGIRVCRDCRRPIDVAHGEWVAKHPDRDVRGYHVTRLIAPVTDISTIIAASKKRQPFERQVFFNKDLGEPYAPAEGRLSREVIAAAQSAGGGYTQGPAVHGEELITMGVDVASTRALNVRISKHTSDTTKIALHIGTVDSFDELAALMSQFAVKMCAIDHLPDGRLSRSFANRFPGRVYLVSFDTVQHPKDSEVFKVNEEMAHVRVRRTEAMDATAQMIRDQRNLLPADLPEGYVEAMQAPVRYARKDELGRMTVGYRSSGADDYYFAETYDLVATEVWFYRQHRNALERETFQPLDEMLEFERSGLGDYARDDEYQPGGREDGGDY